MVYSYVYVATYLCISILISSYVLKILRIEISKLAIIIFFKTIAWYTVPLDLNFTYARAQKATARNIHGNARE